MERLNIKDPLEDKSVALAWRTKVRFGHFPCYLHLKSDHEDTIMASYACYEGKKLFVVLSHGVLKNMVVYSRALDSPDSKDFLWLAQT